MHAHAVLLPHAALVHPAGVGVGLLIRHRGPGEAAECGGDQADVGPPPVVGGDQGHSVGVRGTHQAAVLLELTVGPWELVGGGELAVHPDVALHVGEAGVHLGPTRGVPEP